VKRKTPKSDNLKGDKTDNTDKTDKKGKNQGHGKLMRFTPVKDSRNRKLR
jgi:hypothetical protein